MEGNVEVFYVSVSTDQKAIMPNVYQLLHFLRNLEFCNALSLLKAFLCMFQRLEKGNK